MSLELRHEHGGLRHYLEGKAVHCGEELKLLISAGGKPSYWVWARYEATFQQDCISPILYTTFGRVIPDASTRLRWPSEDEQ